MLVKVLAPGYYSRQDTKTPVKYGIIAMLSNMLFNIILAIPYGYVGLAIATALSATLNAGLLWSGLYFAGVYQAQRSSVFVLLRILFAALVMAGVLAVFNPALPEWGNLSLSAAALKLFMLIGAGAFIYFVLLFALGLRAEHFKVSEADD
jgi:putative peptidoglycan lipid II flippase